MTNMPDEFLKDLLDNEELEILEKIKAKIETKLQSGPAPKSPKIDMSDPYAFDDVNKIPNISDEDRELIFYIRGELSTIDFNNQKYLSLNQCYNQNYHIAIPSGSSYEDSLKQFVDTLENSLTKFANKLNNIDNE